MVTHASHPVEIDRDAPVIVMRDRVIAASIARIWAMHVDIAEWPNWQKDILTTATEIPLVVGSRFTWTTAGLDTPIVSTIYAVEPLRSTLWGGPSAGIIGVHHWLFEPAATGTLVITEESWSGAAVEADPAAAKAMLETSLERWLDFLADAATSQQSDAFGRPCVRPG